MSLARVKVWGSETLTASDLNNEFNNYINNALSLISPLTGALDWDGYAHTLDAAAATTVQSTAAIAWTFTPGAKTGTPGTTGAVSNWAANTYTDNNTAGSGTAASFVAHAFQRPTLAATNASVTTTDAATVYIANSPADGTNNIITNAWALWVDSGASRFDGSVTLNVEDARTTTIATPLIVRAVTTGTPAAGIGTGVLFEAESADENPSNIGQLEFSFTDVNTGSEDSYLQVLLRVAGAALTSCYRFSATGAFNARFTHANTAARDYTLPNVSGTLSLGITLGTSQASTSGTSIDFTGIPATAKRITITLNAVSTSGTSNLLIQIGDSEGIETTGYLSGASDAAGYVGSTAGFIVTRVLGATDQVSGQVILTVQNAATFQWCSSGNLDESVTAAVASSAGTKAPTLAVDRVRITTVGGAETFDAGAINIAYES